MEPEHSIIPYHATDLTGRRVLVFAPHPDDEIIGCGGALAIHAEAGDPVKVVFMTNGAAGDFKSQYDRSAYIQIRKDEAIRACGQIGIDDCEFWDFEDRRLAGSRRALCSVIEVLNSYAPELVYAPSPMEFHPDHRAAHFLVSYAIPSCTHGFDIAFYEVNQPIAPNCLVDISRVASSKFDALAVYKSQLAEMDYKGIFEGLNRFHRLTLPEGTVYAEAFYRISGNLLREENFFHVYTRGLSRRIPPIESVGPLVSVIVRTKNRPELLAGALKSVIDQTYRSIEIILVNDGGNRVDHVVKEISTHLPVTYIEHPVSRGPAAAANSGLNAARGKYINFLDDDDVLYPDHLTTLVSFCSGSDKKVVYSGAKRMFLMNRPAGSPEKDVFEAFQYNFDFNPDALLFFKYIPIMCVLFDRQTLMDIQKVDESLAVYEDWDFWIRMSRCHRFYHINNITAEYRSYAANSRELYRWPGTVNLENRYRVLKKVRPYIRWNTWLEGLKFIISSGYLKKIVFQIRHCMNRLLNRPVLQ